MTKFIPLETVAAEVSRSLPRTQGREQQQQWLLSLEKAYLKLAGAESDADGSATASNPASLNRSAAKTAVAAQPEEKKLREPDLQPTKLPSQTPDTNLETSTSGVAPAPANGQLLPSVALARSLGYKPTLVPRQLSSTASLPQRVLGEIGELKMASLLKTEQGYHLVVRDIHSGEVLPLVARLRRLFADLQLPLVRITLNGAEVWSQLDDSQNHPAEAARSAVNKIY